MCKSVRGVGGLKNATSTSVLRTELWRRLRICTGVSQRPPTHPNPVDEAEQLCQQFVMRSDPLNLNAETQKILDILHLQREAMIHQAINSNCVTDQPFNISELEHTLHRKKDTAPREDECTYSPNDIQTAVLKIMQPIMGRRQTA